MGDATVSSPESQHEAPVIGTGTDTNVGCCCVTKGGPPFLRRMIHNSVTDYLAFFLLCVLRTVFVFFLKLYSLKPRALKVRAVTRWTIEV